MHALALARQRLRNRLQSPSTPEPVRLAHFLVEQGRGTRIPLLSSPLARDILRQGYDPRTLQRVYGYAPAQGSGLVGRVVERMIQELPLHEGLRELHEAAVGELRAAAIRCLQGGEASCVLLFAPCGVGNEIAAFARSMRERWPQYAGAVRCCGVDPDPNGEFLPMARAAASRAGIPVELIREDLRRHRAVAAAAERVGGFHAICGVDLTQRYSGETLAGEIGFLAGLLRPGGVLLVDRRERCEEARKGLGAPLRVPARYLKHAALRDMALQAGLRLEREHATGEGGCFLVVCRKPGESPAASA